MVTTKNWSSDPACKMSIENLPILLDQDDSHQSNDQGGLRAESVGNEQLGSRSREAKVEVGGSKSSSEQLRAARPEDECTAICQGTGMMQLPSDQFVLSGHG